MASSSVVPFEDHVVEADGKEYVEIDFYFYMLKIRDELIDEQRQEISKLKQKVNKLEQRK